MGSDSGLPSVDVFSGKLRIEQGKNRMLVNDGSNDILLAGEDDAGDIVFKVSQSGYDVKTATDQQLAFSSGFNQFKIVGKQHIVVSKGTNTNYAQTSYVHGLGYRPGIVGYVEGSWNSGASFVVPYTLNSGSSIQAVCGVAISSTTLTCYISTDNASSIYSGAQTVTFDIYLLAETAT